MGVESIAVDPADPNRVYLACGTYTNPRTPNGAILRSDNQGQSFQRTDVPLKFGGNEDGRGNGERLAVDPRDGHILYLGTRHDGLWRSIDRGATWAPVAGFPDVKEAIPTPPAPIPGETPEQRWRQMPVNGSGIVFVKFIPMASLESGLYHSTDCGASFTRLASIDSAPLVGFGMAAQGSSYPTVYAAGTVKGVYGIFRSKDAGSSWARINDVAHQFGALGDLTGDPRIYGRVYVGTEGRGIIYGDVSPHSRASGK